MQLTLKPLEKDGLIRLSCAGILTLRDWDASEDPIHELLGAHCYTQTVLLNLEGAESADTSGMVWLTREHQHFFQAGGRLILHSVPQSISCLLDLLCLRPILLLACDEKQAALLAADRVPAEAASTAADAEPPNPTVRVHPATRDRPPRAS